MKKSFTLVEILIVVAIIGILAAIVIPLFQSYSLMAKESVAKDDLRVLRAAIELYAAQHNGVVPGYPDNNVNKTPSAAVFKSQLTSGAGGEGNFGILQFPANPISGNSNIFMIPNSSSLPSSPVMSNLYGWIYMPLTKQLRLNTAGTDKNGVKYFDY